MTDSEASVSFVSGGDAFLEKWTDDAFGLQREGKIVAIMKVQAGVTTENVSGPCPRCGHLFSSVTMASTPVARGPLTVPPGEWKPVLVRCGCDQPHESRPDTQPCGCGARYNVSAKVVTG